ncbi:molybdopterin-dependent oxidoreductase [Halomonas sp. TRM85114]|uniref:molybdopterin-dependent oxidoreductase n=1 Tax=Halomonas jincaotanensis TaxID=2810616 RepID=UPI001BD1C702|nr:molybdopterin-dependent oxidoreductase [Halomonas jincaotanensis]MBS9404291.1 molybdopterin-dependent oxidoreductase [Halomonas jincaotanensis]
MTHSPKSFIVLVWLLLMAWSGSAALAFELAVTHGAEARTLTLDDVEAVGGSSIDMHHPEGFEGRFTGVWLGDFLAAQGMDEARRVRFIAHDGYNTFLTPQQRGDKDYFLVTRLDGEPIAVEDYGPFMLVVPQDAEAVLEGTESMTRWIWGIREVSAR